MIRDTTEGKTNYLNVRFGPMLKRWATHLTKGREKYADTAPGVPNWTLAGGVAEYLRFKESAARHFEQWIAGDRDEDHASAVFFNINGAEFVLEKDPSIDPAAGTKVKKKPQPLQHPLGTGGTSQTQQGITGINLPLLSQLPDYLKHTTGVKEYPCGHKLAYGENGPPAFCPIPHGEGAGRG